MSSLWKGGEVEMTVKEAILTLNANVVFACGRAGFSSATVKMIEDALDTIEDALKAQEPVKYSTRKGVNGFSFVWTCGHCGKDLQPNNRAASYCSYCGKKVKWDD